MDQALADILREADELPEGKRQQIAHVLRQEIQKAKDELAALPKRRLVDFIGAGKGIYKTPEEADAFIRKLRDEWER
jgi:hypothetical protein